MNHRPKNGWALACVAVALLGATACDDDFEVGNLNGPELEDFQTNPTTAAVRDALQGLQVGMRFGISTQLGFVPATGTVARESYIFDDADPRFITELIAGQLNNSGFGGAGWTVRYANVRLAELVLDALGDPAIQETLSPAEIEAARGFVNTVKAVDLLVALAMRDVNGIVLDVDVPVGETPGPIVAKSAALDGIAALLDEAASQLTGGGASFPFRLAPGFGSFDDPASFLEFNRALKARVEVYRESYSGALSALAESFLDADDALGLGVYYTFGGGSGDTFNDIATSPNVFGHPSLLEDAQSTAGGERDRRATEKLRVLDAPVESDDLVTDVDFALYDALDAPIPIVKNEDLLLLRSEARWFTGDREGAMDDLNRVRQRSGGLEPLEMPATDEAFVTALLYERRYSLLFEGHRLVDVRRFDRLDTLPIDRPGDRVAPAFPIPRAECQARGLGESCSAG